MSMRSYNAFGSNLRCRHNFANASNRSYYSCIGSYTKTEHMWWNYTDNGKDSQANRTMLPDRHSHSDEDTWDLSDSLADLYNKVNEQNIATASKLTVCQQPGKDVDVKKWIDEDTSHGFIRVFVPNGDINTSRLIPCTLNTSTQKVCVQCGIAQSSLHVQFNGDIIARMDPTDHPLAIQNEFLGKLGYSEPKKIQEQGYNTELCYLIKFYLGKPVQDGTYSRNQLSSIVFVRKGKLIYQWVQRLCALSGTRLFVHRDKYPTSKKSIMQLAKGYVEELKLKDHQFVLKLTSTLQEERSIYLSFTNVLNYNKWLKRIQKATAKLPTKADLSKCNLEFLPETLFINEDLRTLNLRHNVLQERPLEEDIYSIGWLDDLPRFRKLCNLNLANNDLKSFPPAICSIRSLVELNLASNKLEEIPPAIMDLSRLQILRLHNNHLTSLPEEMSNMKRLTVLILAFNHFTTVPQVLLRIHSCSDTMDSIIMAGNYIERLHGDLLSRMKLVKRIDFRMNRLTLLPSEIAKFQCLEFMTHLDIRDNSIENLDIRALKGLMYINCERNGMYSLQLSGVGLKYMYAGNNELSSLNITPKPEWLIEMDLSHNNITELPAWVAECFFMAKLDVSYNKLTHLPNLIFTMAKKLQELRAHHNRLKQLPPSMGNISLETLQLQHNHIEALPHNLLINANKLKNLNLTKNRLKGLPSPNSNESLNKLLQLFLTANRLRDDVFHVIGCFPRLKKLHLAENLLEDLPDSCISKLETLEELNISSNSLSYLPATLCKHPKLQILRANSNMICELPDFKEAPELKVLEVGFNRLHDLSMSHLMDSQVSLLDISGNPNLYVDVAELEGLKHKKRVCLIDMRGQNRSLQHQQTTPAKTKTPWQIGFSQTSGMRNKLCVAILNKPKFNKDGEDGLFGIFDGGKNEEVALNLTEIMEGTVLEELECPLSVPGSTSYMKYALFSCHRKLKSIGQKIGASAAICHIKKIPDINKDGDMDNEGGDDNGGSENGGGGKGMGGGGSTYCLTVANVGLVEVVLCRHGQPVRLTHRFSVDSDRSECMRIQKSDGIITEDGRVNGITACTRLLGSGYLYPHVIPKPHVKSVRLEPDDQFIIVANQEVWKYVDVEEAVRYISPLQDPVVCAKALQDLAQGYGATENLSVMVINLQPSKIRRANILPLLRFPQIGNDTVGARASRILHDKVFGDSVFGDKLGDNTPSGLCSIVESDEAIEDSTPKVSLENVAEEKREVDQYMDGVKVKPPPSSKGRFRKKDIVHEWGELLQQRLVEEVKSREVHTELQSMFTGTDEQKFLEGPETTQKRDNNWSTTENRFNKNINIDTQQRLAIQPEQPNTSANAMFFVGPSESSSDSREDRLYDIPAGIDRDAILFYKMQMARLKSGKTGSMSSVQSDPMYASLEELAPRRVTSHSIEVLVRAMPNMARIGQMITPPLPPPQTTNSKKKRGSTMNDTENIYSMVEKVPVSRQKSEAIVGVPYISLPNPSLPFRNAGTPYHSSPASGSDDIGSGSNRNGPRTSTGSSIIISYL